MKFSVSKDKLLEGLSTVQNVVSTRTTLPILSNVLLQASDGEIRLTRLIERKILLPGVTVLARLIARVRDRASSRLWRVLAALPNADQRTSLQLRRPSRRYPGSCPK